MKNRNEVCWCGSGKKYKKCHLRFDERMAEIKPDVYKGQSFPPRQIIKNDADIEGIRKSAVINDAALDLVAAHMKVGVDTETLNRIAHQYIVAQRGIPACLDYQGYPKSICISLNNVVCHGIPSETTVLKEGDIVNVDITTILNGYYADASRMFIIGEATSEAEKLVRVALECMEAGIAAIRPWGYLGDIGAAIDALARENGYSVVTDLGGHGVGKDFHEEPFVPHVGERDTGMLLVPGMVLTVEPMINAGAYKVRVDKQDGWTVYTADGSLSAQWEKTVLITEAGVEILAK